MTSNRNELMNDSIQEIALKYQLDRNDPMFSVLEKIDEYHHDFMDQMLDANLKEKQSFELINQTFELRISELNRAMERLSGASSSFNSDAKLISESTAGLVHYWRQIHWYHALTGMFVTLCLCAIAFGFLFYHSADRKLQVAGVTLKSDPSTQVVRLTLSGKKVVASARSDHEIFVEFSR